MAVIVTTPPPIRIPEESLSTGDVDAREMDLHNQSLEDSQQTRNFRRYNFWIAWTISIFFFISVSVFSWKAVFSENSIFFTANKIEIAGSGISDAVGKIIKEIESTKENKDGNKDASSKENLNEKINDIAEKIKDGIADEITSKMANQFLFFLSLLSAIGLTLAISVMRFSSTHKQDEKDITIPISPLASAVSDFIKAVTGLIKKD